MSQSSLVESQILALYGLSGSLLSMSLSYSSGSMLLHRGVVLGHLVMLRSRFVVFGYLLMFNSCVVLLDSLVMLSSGMVFLVSLVNLVLLVSMVLLSVLVFLFDMLMLHSLSSLLHVVCLLLWQPRIVHRDLRVEEVIPIVGWERKLVWSDVEDGDGLLTTRGPDGLIQHIELSMVGM